MNGYKHCMSPSRKTSLNGNPLVGAGSWQRILVVKDLQLFHLLRTLGDLPFSFPEFPQIFLLIFVTFSRSEGFGPQVIVQVDSYINLLLLLVQEVILTEDGVQGRQAKHPFLGLQRWKGNLSIYFGK